MLTIEPKINLISAVSLINDENKVLIGKRPIVKRFPLFWEFPGGKVESNETPEEAIIREAREEININLEYNCLAPLTFSTYKESDLEIILLLYVARIWTLEPKAIYHSEIKWVKPQNLRQYKMPPANNILISSLQDLLI